MLKIGLTGGIASGKSTVSHLFAQRGITVIDADQIARALVQVDAPCYLEIIKAFGSTFLQADRQLDRAKLRQLIFSDSLAKRQLEAILHPPIRQQLITQSDHAQSPYCLLVVPLLIETKMTHRVDRTLVIDLSKQNQLQRLCEREGMSLTLAESIINQQASKAQRLAMASDVIINDSNIQHLKDRVLQLHEKYLRLANSTSDGCQPVHCHGE